MSTAPAPCTGCGSDVLPALLLARRTSRGGAAEPIGIDPDEQPVEAVEGLLLCVGRTVTGRRVMIPMESPGSLEAARRVRGRAHCHRLHVCATVPADWTAVHAAAGAAS